MSFRDRIRELRRVRAADLIPNPRNWRTHSDAQRSALRGILESIGYASAALARETPEGLMLIDGHLRAGLEPDAEVPVLVLDVDEDEADALLATFDPLAAMAGRDGAALSALRSRLAGAPGSLQDALSAILGKMQPTESIIPPSLRADSDGAPVSTAAKRDMERYPLAIVLDAAAVGRWKAWKKGLKTTNDTKAFLALLEGAEVSA